MPKLTNEYRARIAKLRNEEAAARSGIDALERKMEEVRAHCRLLYSKGPALEDAVVRAFKALGYDDIEPIGGADREDAAFGMGRGARYLHGVIEAKGSDKGTLMRHILQSKNWANRRAVADSRASKGIFVPNQHRQRPYPKSRKARLHIEPNQLEQAELNDVCIIPSCVLFEAVRRVLEGESPDRARITAKIADCKGVLTDVL